MVRRWPRYRYGRSAYRCSSAVNSARDHPSASVKRYSTGASACSRSRMRRRIRSRAVPAAFLAGSALSAATVGLVAGLLAARTGREGWAFLGTFVAIALAVAGLGILVATVGLDSISGQERLTFGSAGLLAGVFPGNVKMAADAGRGKNTVLKVVSLARLPLQAPMIRAMVKVARDA